MICYRDRTYCPYWQDCRNADDCPRCLTDEVRRAAERAGLPISQYGGKPDCYESSECTAEDVGVGA